VNDIVIGGAKVCGVLAHSQAVQKTVTGAVLGIGLNVESTPIVAPTPYTPNVASLRNFVEDASSCSREAVFFTLIRILADNYARLLDGGYRRLLDRYCRRSGVIGKNVTVCFDDRFRETVSGKVERIGDELELYLENIDKPVSRGRLILDE
jgi:biotin-(acetyl-CoA carboxylase) ligase